MCFVAYGYALLVFACGLFCWEVVGFCFLLLLCLVVLVVSLVALTCFVLYCIVILLL